jgi:hypothetical protein
MEEEGSAASGSGGAAYGDDEFEQHTREGERVLDEMSDEEEDGRTTDNLGGACHLHKDVSTVPPEHIPISLNEKKIGKNSLLSCMTERTRNTGEEKNTQKPPPLPSAPDA